MNKSYAQQIKDQVAKALVDACSEKEQRYLDAKAEYEGFRDAKAEAYAVASAAIDEAIKHSFEDRRVGLAGLVADALRESNDIYLEGTTDCTKTIKSVVDAYEFLRRRLNKALVDSASGG